MKNSQITAHEMVDAIIKIFLILCFTALFYASIKLATNFHQRRKKLLPELLTGKPMILFFWSDTQRCRESLSLIEKLKNEFKENISVVNINILRDFHMAESYLVLNTPTIILFDNEGNPIFRENEVNYDKIAKKLKEIL